MRNLGAGTACTPAGLLVFVILNPRWRAPCSLSACGSTACPGVYSALKLGTPPQNRQSLPGEKS
jgi:hypothetical protein